MNRITLNNTSSRDVGNASITMPALTPINSKMSIISSNVKPRCRTIFSRYSSCQYRRWYPAFRQGQR